jgi:cytoskeleton protein RodZ
MSDTLDAVSATPAEPRATTAGGLIRQARQAKGLHIAALAAAIKVVPQKLEWLESDQYDKLPDATFTRALAQAVCRVLKVDAAPVLALLPPPNGHRLEQVSEGLNTPFHDRPGRFVPREWARVTSPALWVTALLVVGALLLYVLPPGWLPLPAGSRTRADAPASAPVAASAGQASIQQASAPSGSMAGLTQGADLLAPEGPASGSVGGGINAVPAAAGTGGVLEFRTSAPSWIEVVDASGLTILGRLVQPSEAVALEGAVPLKVRIGNASGTQLVFHGQPVDLTPFTRDNVARLELK